MAFRSHLVHPRKPSHTDSRPGLRVTHGVSARPEQMLICPEIRAVVGQGRQIQLAIGDLVGPGPGVTQFGWQGLMTASARR